MNNAFFIPLIWGVSILATSYSSTLVAGQLATGADIIGNDPLSKAIEAGVEGAVSMSMEAFPESTVYALQKVQEVGELKNVVFEVLDEETGGYVSGTYNQLSDENKNRVDALLFLVSVGATGLTVTKSIAKSIKKIKIPKDTVKRLAKSKTNNRGGVVNSKIDNDKKWTPKEINGRRVYQKNDLFDPNQVDELGESNLAKMKKGKAPIGRDGEVIELHHMTQNETIGFTNKKGSLAEVSNTFHKDKKNSYVIHINQLNKNYPEMNQGIDKSSFRQARRFDEKGKEILVPLEKPIVKIDKYGNETIITHTRKNLSTTEASQYETYRKKYWKERVKDFE